MESLTDINVIKNLLHRHGFSFARSLGQNFLINPSVCPRMADACGCEQIGVLEIGPGVGVLTRELASRAKRVVAVEIDMRLKPVLAETLAGYDNVHILWDDLLKLNLADLIAAQFGDLPVCVCANLPYYITSPILMQLLESRIPFTSIVTMVQKEAAQRICAPPGTRQCGAVSLAVSYFSQPEVLLHVSKGSFLPAPKVDSAVISLTPHPNPPVNVDSEQQFFALIRAAFNQRRKTLPNAVSAGLGIEKSRVLEALLGASIPQTARAETLTLSDFAKLSQQLTVV